MTDTAASSQVAGSKPRPKRPSKAKGGSPGIAVLMVVACLAILAPFTLSFNYQARVDFQSAVNVRDEVAARQIQRGAMSLGLLLFEIQRLVFNQKQFRDFVGSMDITMVAPYLMSVFGTEDGAEGLGSMVGIDTSALSDLAITGGTFEFRVYAESGKINVNCLAQQAAAGAGGGGDGNRPAGDNPAGRVVETLEALMLPTLFDPYFEEEKADGQYYTRTDIVRNIADYIDDDRESFDVIRMRPGSKQENYRYQQLFDSYRERNGRLDSIEELHLVEGIDDDWMAAFSHELTTYGGCKVNLNFASADQIALVLRHAAKGDDRWKTEGENYLLKTLPLANYIVEMRQFTLFKSLKDFAEIAEKPDGGVNPLAMMGGNVEDSTGMPRIPEGIALWQEGKEGKDGWVPGLDDIATVAPERVYTVEIITTVGAVNKRLTAVYDMQYARSQSQGKGAWLHIREE